MSVLGPQLGSKAAKQQLNRSRGAFTSSWRDAWCPSGPSCRVLTRSARRACAAPRASAAAPPTAAAGGAEAPRSPRLPASQSSLPANEDMSSTLSLANIRSSLIRQEDTIIFQLIERAQFARNNPVYVAEGVPVPGYDVSGRRYSLLEYVLRETEQLHGSVRRYTSPTEHPFFPDEVPRLVLPPISYPPVLAPCAPAINFNDRIMRVYLEDILPAIAEDGDDGNYGSAATLDVLVLQALSTRIHYGKFVAEAKFRARPEAYASLIRAGDAAGLMALLTDEPQERRVVERVRVKAATFGQDIELPAGAAPDGPGGAAALLARAAASVGGSVDFGPAPRFKVCYDSLADIYDRIVMPLTKDVQVEYLLRRLDGEADGGAA
ncbi:MAG: chorismate mutase [Monoraphidium minutum]|nr:MAG: chorismate mutase [Monoraphidium minutum]